MSAEPRLAKLKECFTRTNFIPQSGCSAEELQLATVPPDVFNELGIRIGTWRGLLILIDRAGNALSPQDIENLQIKETLGVI